MDVLPVLQKGEKKEENPEKEKLVKTTRRKASYGNFKGKNGVKKKSKRMA